MTEKKIEEITDPLELAAELGKSIKRINELFAFRRWARRIVIGLSIAVLFDITLTLVVVLFYRQLHSTQVLACERSRLDQLSVWHTILHQFTSAHTTSQQHLNDVRFSRFVNQELNPQNCNQLYNR